MKRLSKAASLVRARPRRAVAVVAVAGALVAATALSGSADQAPRGTVQAQVSEVAARAADPGEVVVDPLPTGAPGVRLSPDGAQVTVALGGLAPADSTLALALPAATAHAWDLVSRLMYAKTHLVKVDLDGSKVADLVGAVGYASFPANGDTYVLAGASAGGSSVDAVYLATGSPEAAVKVRDYLLGEGVRKNFNAESIGPVVVITSVWADPTKVLTSPRLETNQRYSSALADLPASAGNSLWMDVGAYATSYGAGLGDEGRTAFTNYLSTALGSESAAFVAQAPEDAYSWVGTSSAPLLTTISPQGASSIADQLLASYVSAPAGQEGGTGALESVPIPPDVLTASLSMEAVAVTRKDKVAVVTIDTDTLSGYSSMVAPGSNIASVRAAANDATVNLDFTPSKTIWDGGEEYDSTGARG